MADVSTTKTDLLSRFADNSIGLVSAEDSRALINSVMGVAGAMAWTGPAGEFTASATPTTLSAFDLVEVVDGVVASPTGGLFAISIGGGGVWSLTLSMSVELASARRFEFRVLSNGVPGPVPFTVDGTGDATVVTIAGDIELDAGDTVGVQVTSADPNADIEVLGGVFSLTRLV